jgi:hypothetical protein
MPSQSGHYVVKYVDIIPRKYLENSYKYYR